jgi:uncharacterized Zn-finger protein
MRLAKNTILVKKTVITCNGNETGDPSLIQEKIHTHHPVVYLYVDEKEGVVCPYCSKHFFLRPSQKHSNEKSM